MYGLQAGLFADKRVVITGAGRGIGAAIAEYLVNDGAHVLAHLGREGGEANWIFPADGTTTEHLTTCCADLATTEGVEQVLQTASKTFEQVNILINNAGTMLGRVPTESLTVDHYRAVSDLNSQSVVLLCSGLLPQLKQSENASIVNVTSISAVTGGSPGSSIYSAAKGFVSTYTRSLATELASFGIRVNAISPGTIDTDFHQRYSSPEKLERTANNTPLKRLGTAEDCVPACLFLASETLSGYITGQIVGINGGSA